VKKLVLAGLLAGVLCAATKKHDWKDGKVMDASASTTYRDSVTVKESRLLIVGEEFSYLVTDTDKHVAGAPLGVMLIDRAVSRKHVCRLIVNDAVKYAQEKNSLWLLGADGKECKMEIMRQERLPAPVAP
jgi:hypothetical protein